MNVLILTDDPPRRGAVGNPARYFHLIKAIARLHRVCLVCLSRSPEDRQDVPELQRICDSVEVVDVGRSRLRHLPHCLSVLLRGQPVENAYSDSWAVRRRIRRLCLAKPLDVIHVEQARLATYLPVMRRAAKTKAILFLHNVGPVLFERIRRIEDRWRRRIEYGLDAVFSRIWEHRVCRRFDRCVVFSEQDRRHHLAHSGREDTSVIPFGIDVKSIPCLPRMPDGQEMLYIGKMTYPPNRDAVLYFCREILPRILTRRADAKFNAVGHPPMAGLHELVPAEALNVVGYVDDPVSIYRRCALSVVPLRAGSGVRMKILESMAFGRPVVSTSLGCEGLELTHGENIWIADTPEAFADGVLRLLSDQPLWQRMAANGRRFVEDRHDIDNVSAEILRLYEDVRSPGSVRHQCADLSARETSGDRVHVAQ